MGSCLRLGDFRFVVFFRSMFVWNFGDVVAGILCGVGDGDREYSVFFKGILEGVIFWFDFIILK